MVVDSRRRTPEGFLTDQNERIVLLERRLARGVPARLSTTGQEVTDWNDVVQAGFYWSQEGALNGPVSTSRWWEGTVVVNLGGSGVPRVVQTVYESTTSEDRWTNVWRRFSVDGGETWTEWTGFAQGTQTTNWSSARLPGRYWGSNAANQPPTPNNDTWWVGEVSATLISGSTRGLEQRLYRPTSGDGRTYFRTSGDGGSTWSAWRQPLSAHVGDASNGRLYLSTDQFFAGATQDNSESTYIALSPVSDSNAYAMWLNHKGSNLLLVRKDTKQIILEDTGWVTSGVSIGHASGWSLDSYSLRRKHGRLQGVVSLKRTGGNLTTGDATSPGNIADQSAIITMPSGWRLTSSKDYFVVAQRSGYPGWLARVKGGNSGAVDLTAGTFPAQVLATGDMIEIPIDYDVD